MSVLKKYFDSSLNQESPVQPDFERFIDVDENGNEYVSWKETDYTSIRLRNGSVSAWSLNSLLAAGIDPKFGIHTGNPTRLEGVGVVNDASAYLDSIMSETKNED